MRGSDDAVSMGGTLDSRRMRGGADRTGLQDSILRAIQDPLPPDTTLGRNMVPPATRRSSVASVVSVEGGGGGGGGGGSDKENAAAATAVEKGAGKAEAKAQGAERSVSTTSSCASSASSSSTTVTSREDDEVFELLQKTPMERLQDATIDVTMSKTLTPTGSVSTAEHSTVVMPEERRHHHHPALKVTSSFLDASSLSVASSTGGNRSMRPKSFACEDKPLEWRGWLRACTDGDLATAKRILEKDSLILNWAPSAGRVAGVHAATRCDHAALVGWLRAHGADLNQATQSGHTPLHIAAQQNNRAMVDALLVLGADPTRRDVCGRTYEYYAAWADERRHRAALAFRSPQSTDPGERARSRPPSIYSRDSMASAASSFGRSSSIRDAVRGFFRTTFKKTHSLEKLNHEH